MSCSTVRPARFVPLGYCLAVPISRLPKAAASGLRCSDGAVSACKAEHNVSKPHRPPEVFGYDLLTSREAEIMQMILKGHSGLSISMVLGITVPTVKTHRKNRLCKIWHQYAATALQYIHYMAKRQHQDQAILK